MPSPRISADARKWVSEWRANRVERYPNALATAYDTGAALGKVGRLLTEHRLSKAVRYELECTYLLLLTNPHEEAHGPLAQNSTTEEDGADAN